MYKLKAKIFDLLRLIAWKMILLIKQPQQIWHVLDQNKPPISFLGVHGHLLPSDNLTKRNDLKYCVRITATVFSQFMYLLHREEAIHFGF